ncbi:MAG: response regulator [Bacteriovoracaceae bacterium]|jgi:CheY-like chemotaxis protein|nr:response regulator [Bacteriovoracaceae bacterium]
MKFLIIDDNREVQTVLRDVLELADDFSQAEIHLASDGLEAFDKMKEVKYDILFIDIHMPFMDGRSLLKAKYEKPNLNKDTPAIVISGDSTNLNIGEIEDNVIILNKPFSLERVCRVTKLMLEKKQIPRKVS